MPSKYDVLTYEDRKKQANLGHDMSGVSTAAYSIAVPDTGGRQGLNTKDPQNVVKPNKSQYNATNKYTPSYKGYSYTPVSLSAPSIGHIGQFAPSQAYIDAMNYTQSLLDKINSGRTSYSDKVDAMMAKIEGRDPFSYDFNADPLFQNMLGSAMASGQTAMQDTMGQAAALTGGYGSSYATSAGNQAYNQFVQNAYAQLPEYYKLALDAYTREGDEMYRQLGMYNDADDKEYGRLTNAYGLNYQKAQDMYGQEYNNYWDTANYNLSVDKYNADAAMDAARFNASQALDVAKFNYAKQQDAQTRADKLKSDAASADAAASAGASSADFTKALNMAEDLAKAYSYSSDELAAGIEKISSMYGLNETQIANLYQQIYAWQTVAANPAVTAASKSAIASGDAMGLIEDKNWNKYKRQAKLKIK